MPSKSFVSEAELGSESLRSETRYYEVRSWDPGCSRPPEISESANNAEVEAPVGPITYAARSGYINYANSNFRHYNPCTHVTHECGLSGNGAATITWEEIFHEDPSTSGCDSDQCYIDATTSRKLLLNLSGSFLAEQVPYGPIGIPGYLGIGSTRYLEKVRYLDALALDTMIPKLDTGFSLPQFLVELLELKMLWKSAIALFRGIFGVATTPIMAARDFFGNDPLKSISSSYLATIFGVLPLVKDIQTIIEKLITQRKAIADFMYFRNKSRTFHFEKRLNKLTFRDEEWFSGTGNLYLSAETHYANYWFARDHIYTIDLATTWNREIDDLVYHASLEYSYDVQGIPEYLMSFLAYLDHWGVNLSISDVWEIVPFSFVVDWFYNVGNLLDRYDFVNLPVSVIIYDYCRSFKYNSTYTSTVGGLNSLILSEGGPDMVSSYGATITPVNALKFQMNQKAYYRAIGIPPPSAEQLPNFTFPSGKKWVIASALLLQRRR